MTTRVSADSAADPAAVWPLLARPDRWHEWAPHVRGAWGLGHPEVRAGRRGFVRLLGVVPLPARVETVDTGRSWSWRVGPLRLRHQVLPQPEGSTVVMVVDAPAALEWAYAPLVGLLTRRLARVAERG